ncbi:MAG: RNA methyltransferase [Deltaproteobacteria bacterium]|jgi:tRNA (guanosine-2'-O-)-methyltransferase|nr:RNA methyltransferase [Deltaproteobacteria bacterium]MBW2536303.1 RNA methyltransferase [Deltaproteobacteria bacterium]
MRWGEGDVHRPTLSEGQLRRSLATADPEPVIALLEPMVTTERRDRIRAVLARRLDSVTVVLDALHDPHNGAAVVRSCDAFGVARIHALERTEPFAASGAVAKGAQHWIEVVGHATAAELVAALDRSGHQLVGAHPAGSLEPADLAAIDRVALVLGNEHAGIGVDLLEACVQRVQVPMRGFVESLNLSVTAAVLLAAATTGRAGDLPARRARRLYAAALVHSVDRSPEILAARGILKELHPSKISRRSPTEEHED